MATEWIAFLSAIFGGIITAVGSFMSSSVKSGTDDKIEFRKSILDRIKQLESNNSNLQERLKELEAEIIAWKGRYWLLYQWGIEQQPLDPPAFHLREMEDLKREFQHSVEKIDDMQKR